MERIVLAALHLLALGIGFGSIMARWITLRRPLTADSLKRVFHFDTQWGIAAALWIVTGLWRWLGSVEKTSGYYTSNHWFLAKMGFLTLILVLEILPMVTLIRWRMALGRGAEVAALPGVSRARTMSTISAVQAVLVVAMVFFAVAMARGYGVVAP
jgi:putative membrane protein